MNQRVNYRLKSNLDELSNSNLLNMDLHIDKFCVGYIVRSLVNIGIERFKNSWNYHRIPKKSVPIELAEAYSRIQKLNNDLRPHLE
jgi:hypothetical protein